MAGEPHEPSGTGPVPYERLSTQQIDDVCAWLDAHRVPHVQVPTDCDVTFDSTCGEWCIEKFAVDGQGQIVFDGDGPRRVTVRRAPKAGLARMPWPGFDPDGRIAAQVNRSLVRRIPGLRKLYAVSGLVRRRKPEPPADGPDLPREDPVRPPAPSEQAPELRVTPQGGDVDASTGPR